MAGGVGDGLGMDANDDIADDAADGAPGGKSLNRLLLPVDCKEEGKGGTNKNHH